MPEPDAMEYRRRQRALGADALHAEAQDVRCDAWKHLLELVDEAAEQGVEEFAPLQQLAPGTETDIVALPASIAKLRAVKRLRLYGSSLVRIPPEIGRMSNLETFTPYTSYRLHWFPYEITRCIELRQTTVSTRALYGNYKYRWSFPRLDSDVDATAVGTPDRCSVCEGSLSGRVRRAWISLWVASDVLPLLVHACSEECIRRLPEPAHGYVQEAHVGGVDVVQPPPSSVAPPRRR